MADLSEVAGAAVRRFLTETLGPDGRPPPDWFGRLAAAGYAAPHWPPPWGLGASPAEQLVIDEELRRAGVGRPENPIGIGWAGPTLVLAGTDQQQRRWLAGVLARAEARRQLFSAAGGRRRPGAAGPAGGRHRAQRGGGGGAGAARPGVPAGAGRGLPGGGGAAVPPPADGGGPARPGRGAGGVGPQGPGRPPWSEVVRPGRRPVRRRGDADPGEPAPPAGAVPLERRVPLLTGPHHRRGGGPRASQPPSRWRAPAPAGRRPHPGFSRTAA